MPRRVFWRRGVIYRKPARAQRSLELGENAEQKGGGVKSSISPAWYPGTCVTFERKSEFTAFLRGRALCFLCCFLRLFIQRAG